MGADGGSINKQTHIHSGKEVDKSTLGERHDAGRFNKDSMWTSCRLLGRQLEPPLVSDYKGQLFNKESVLEWLISKEDFTKDQIDQFGYIKTLKDVVELHLDDGHVRVTGESLTCGKKIVYLVPCGCVLLKSTVDQLTECPACSTVFEDTIPVNDDTALDKLQQRIDTLAEKGLTHSLKPKKRKKVDKEGANKKRKQR